MLGLQVCATISDLELCRHPLFCALSKRDPTDYLLELKLQVVVHHHVGAENQTWVLGKTEQPVSHLSSPITVFRGLDTVIGQN